MLMVNYRLISLALTYAGSYVFGRYQYHRNITPDGHVQAQVKTVPMANWRVYLPGHHEGYISQEEFEDNQVRLARNRTNGEGCVLNGPAREGLTLLQGL
ncbi:TPA: recombinase family protein, partial [Salmonella enterica subsp. enterica serovar Newport]